ncbi:hypothetical protein [Gaopeijia maritima]|uniref:Apea-like HEPN domain-containing protein n=1 Tax=Gaopeijia maritima TaxID=3119007 RepID=A0ABU9E574_9BACT
MYVIKDWHGSHTDVSQYFIARWAQLCDSSESITRRSRTTNGYILLDEIYHACQLAQRRRQNTRRLKAVLTEAADDRIRTSVPNDPVLRVGFPTLIDSVKRWSELDLEPAGVERIRRESLTAVATLEGEYRARLQTELLALDLRGERFDTLATRIEEILGALLPQLLYEGHSLAFLQLPARQLWKRNLDDETIPHVLKFVSDEHRTYACFLPTGGDEPLKAQLRATDESLTANDFFEPPDDLKGWSFEVAGRDPYTALRESVTTASRRARVTAADVGDDLLVPVWKGTYYKTSQGKFVAYDLDEHRDPVIPGGRADTLRTTLEKVGESLESLSDEALDDLEEPLHFYNLARSVTSLENSYTLLWTALESLTGLRGDKADIVAVQDVLGSALSLGAVGRRVVSTVSRIRSTGKLRGWRYLGPSSSEYEPAGLVDWIVWMVDASTKDSPNDPYEVLNEDPLLCRQWREINEGWAMLGDLRTVCADSERATRYHLDRIYLHRNLVIHSGTFGHPAGNLWVHFEWYVGKLLALAVIMSRRPLATGGDLRDQVAGTLIGQAEATLEYLKRHQQDPITHERLHLSGLTRFPAVCF